MTAKIKRSCVLNEHHSDKSFEAVAEFYKVDKELLEVKQSMYQNSVNNDISSRAKTTAGIVERMFQDGLCDLLPVLHEVATILASIPATSCSVERLFSELRHIKSYLCSTMGQKRFYSVALINIKRAYANLYHQE